MQSQHMKPIILTKHLISISCKKSASNLLISKSSSTIKNFPCCSMFTCLMSHLGAKSPRKSRLFGGGRWGGRMIYQIPAGTGFEMRRKIFPALVFLPVLWYAGIRQKRQELTRWPNRKCYWTLIPHQGRRR